jgi:transcriptional regulator with XRE-family HTH domain
MNNISNSLEQGKRIRLLGLSRPQFHKKTGVSASTLRALELGELKISPSKALLLSHLFILLFKLSPDEASVEVILYGKKEKK